MATIQEMREERARLITEARRIQDAAQAEKRDLSTEEGAKCDELLDASEKIKSQIAGREAAEARARRIEEAAEELRTAPGRNRETNRVDTNDAPERRGDKPSELRWMTRGGRERVIELRGRQASDEYRASYEMFLKNGSTKGLDEARRGDEHRDLAADADASGGYLIAPMQMMGGLIKAVDDAVVVRNFATVIPVRSAQNLGAPSLDTDASDADWTTEIKTGSADSSVAFGMRELNPSPVAKLIKVSRKLIRLAAQSVESLVTDRLAYKFGITQEKAFMTGTGAGQPLGLFTASSLGISTGRDVQTGSATDITADGLIDAKFNLKAAYWNRPSTRWLFHRDAMKRIRKLKDSTNQYLWQPGLTAGEPDRILDIPYAISEYVPNTFTTGKYVGIVGDFSFYWIAEALQLEIQRLAELYAATNQIGFIGRMELDAMPVLEEAFSRMITN